MKKNKINFLLFSTLFIMTLVPILAATVFLDRALKTSFDLGFNPEITQSLTDHARNLKKLKMLDTDDQDKYKEEFIQAQNLLLVYQNKELLKQKVLYSLKLYFFIGLILAFVFALFISFFLSKVISKTYQKLFKNYALEKEKTKYLEEISSWQSLAKMLAHEIKNPLTPMEVILSSIKEKHIKASKDAFKSYLSQVHSIMIEEIQHLKNLVNRFDHFSKIPSLKTENIEIIQFMKRCIGSIQLSFPNTTISFSAQKQAVYLKIDKSLFKQVIKNIIKNGIEANPLNKVHFSINLCHAKTTHIIIKNNGALIPSALTKKIFDPYITSKSQKTNMGLGLAVCKKIMYLHHGDITYQDNQGMPEFILTLNSTA